MEMVLQAIENKHGYTAEYRIFILATLGFYGGWQGKLPQMMGHRGCAAGRMAVMWLV